MTENILGRKIEDIDVAFLIDFFKIARKESDVLEMKSIDSGPNDRKPFKDKQKDVLKTICALLNSSGGIIVWGAPVEIIEAKEKVVKGNLTPTIEFLGKDSFISSLSDKTVPVPANVKFKPLEVEPGKFVYIIEVWESTTKPHQYDHKYYMRLDGQTREAPHHYIEALFKQVKYPNLNGYMKIKDCIFSPNQPTGKFLHRHPVLENYYYLNISFFIINLSPLQNEESISLSTISNLGIVQATQKKYHGTPSGKEVNLTNVREVLHYGSPVILALRITFKETDLVQNNNVATLAFTFDGKFSPQKGSIYKIDFSKYQKDGDFHKMIVEKSLNKTHYERQIEDGVTNEEYLRGIIGEDFEQ